MRLAYLTAGAGGMLCGSCMRDNTLAAALIRQGRKVLLVPVFTPIRTDERDVSQSRVLYGGINVYLQHKSPLFRRVPAFLRRMLDAPALLRAVMRWAGETSGATAGDLTAAVLEGERGPLSAELDELIEAVGEFKPDVVHLPDAFFVGLAREIKRRLGVGVVCTLTGEDIFIDKLPAAQRTRVLELIRTRQRDVDAFIAVTRYYGDYAAREFAIDPARIHHVPLGVHTDDLGSVGPRPTPATFSIGYLARICPEKGLHLLVDAFGRLRAERRDVRLIIGGYLGRPERSYLDKLRTQWRRDGLEDRIDYRGEVDRTGKADLLRACTVLSVPTTYREAKGLSVLEAMAQGVPVVQPAHGSFLELVGDTGGGVLCRPLDSTDLAAKLAGLMDAPGEVERLGRAGHEAVRSRYSDTIMAQSAWRVVEQCARAAGRSVE